MDGPRTNADHGENTRTTATDIDAERVQGGEPSSNKETSVRESNDALCNPNGRVSQANANARVIVSMPQTAYVARSMELRARAIVHLRDT